MNWPIEFVGVVESTMKTAKKPGAQEGSTFVADAQTQGRGRRGREWFSAKDAGLFMTTVLHPPKRPDLSTLALMAGIAVCQGLKNLGVSDTQLKWPNDILFNGRKLGGILLEVENNIVFVGIGLNLAAASRLTLPADIQNRYVGLEECGLEAKDLRQKVLTVTLQALKTCYDLWIKEGFGALLPFWHQADALKNKQVKTLGSPIEGVCLGIDESGALLLQTHNGLQKIVAGEVEKLEETA